MADEITIYRLPGVDAFVIRKGTNSRLFLTTSDTIIISPKVFVSILYALVKQGLLNYDLLKETKLIGGNDDESL